MGEPALNVVTGALGYTGKYVTRRLLAAGQRVVSLSGHPERPNPFGARVLVAPFNFENPIELARSLQGAATLYNTYWVRFQRGAATFDQAVRNTITLVRAARAAGVRRIVHVSITNASADSPLPYFRGKGLLEEVIADSGLSYAIIRPTVIFGAEDILINNIAWLLRRFPVFALPGSGGYRLQPVFVEDVADLAVRAAAEATNITLDAVGPETFTFGELVRLLARAVGSRASIIHVNPGVALFLSKLVGVVVGDVVLTRDEVAGLMAGLLVAEGPATGTTRLSDWVESNSGTLGGRYSSELGRHYRPPG